MHEGRWPALLRGSAWVGSAYVLRLGAQAVALLVLARTLGADGFGRFAAALALVTLVAPFAGWGGGNLLVLRGARVPGDLPAAFGSALAAVAVTAPVLLLGVAAVATAALPAPGAATTVAVLALSELVAVRLVELSAQAFQARDRLDVTARLLVLPSLLRLAATAALAASSAPATPLRWAASYLAANVLAATACLGVAVRALGVPAPTAGGLRTIARHGLFFSVGMASRTAYGDVDKLLLARLDTAAAAGLYTAAYRVVNLALVPIQAIVFAANTRLFRTAGYDGAWRLARRGIGPLAAYGAAAGGALWLAAPLLPVVLGPSYEDAGAALRWLAPLPLIHACHYLVGDALMGAGAQAARSALQLGVAAVNVALNLWLIPAASWRGAAAATLLSEALLGVALVLLLRRLAVTRPAPVAT